MDSNGNWNNWLEVGMQDTLWRAEPLYVDSDIDAPLQEWQKERLQLLTGKAAFHLCPQKLSPKKFYWRLS